MHLIGIAGDFEEEGGSAQNSGYVYIDVPSGEIGTLIVLEEESQP